MFQNEAENNFLLQNFLELGNKTDKSRLKVDFPLESFEQILKNLLDMFQVDGAFETFKQNLVEMTKLSFQFSNIIYSIFSNRTDQDNNQYLYLFLIELMKVPDISIQTNSLTISTNLLKNHEEVVKLFVDNEVYSNILNFFLSEDLQLVKSVSDFFIFSIVTSPKNFLGIFLEDFLDDFIQIFNELDKDDANSRIFYHFCQIFYNLFQNRLHVEVQILENIYQNILFDIFDRRFYIFFLQFVDSILKVHERYKSMNNEEESEEEEDNELLDEFALRFYETDFPRHVLSIFNRFCNSNDENRDVRFIELNLCLKVISNLFKYDIYRPNTTGNTFLENLCEKSPSFFTNEFLKNLEKLINIDEYYDKYGKSINRDNGDDSIFDDFEEDDDDDDNDRPMVNPLLFKEIPINAIRVFIILIKKLGYGDTSDYDIITGADVISIISNYKIFSNFIDKPEDYNYSKRVALTELCLTAVEYSSDSQFEAFLDPIHNPFFLKNVLENIDTGNENHIKALDRMIFNITHRFELECVSNYMEKVCAIFHRFNEILERIQKEIEDVNPSTNGSNLSMLLLQIQKFHDEIPQNDEGMISDDDF